jgi:alcohol dehydrogenase (cytochrome c)
VTDEMLRNPDAGDWLMARRTYQGWSYSPLTQVTRDTVKDLQLAWVWTMQDGGANEPTPVVHDGTMFLMNTANVMQALDARTGELIWEHRVPPYALIGAATMRNIAVYDDKVFMATTDAHLVALDARTGKQVGATAIADRAKGYSAYSGPIVIRGKVLQGLTGCDRFGNDGCWISAYDAATGSLAWKFTTVARSGQPGSETWGKLGDPFRVGGETWIAGTSAPTSSSRKPANGCRRARARRAAITGRPRATTPAPGSSSFPSASRAWKCLAGRSSRRSAPAGLAPTADSSRCRVRTGIWASSRRTT